MIAMIRINLIGTSKGRKRRKGMPDIPNVGVLLFVLLLVIEGAVLYSWHAGAVEQATNVRQKLNRFNHELETLTAVQTQMTGLKNEITALEKNTWLFDELTAEKIGPVDALTFLSFILHDRDEATHPTEELKQMEAAGWRVGWKANRAWFTTVRENRGEVTLTGEAIDHEDVAEVQRRLESSAHFREVQLVFQEVKTRESVGTNYVEFTLKASLIYLVDPVDKPVAAEAADAEAPVREKPADSASPDLQLPSAASVPRDRPAVEEPVLPVAVTAGASADPGADGGPPAGAPAAGAEQPDEKVEKVGLPGLGDLLEAR